MIAQILLHREMCWDLIRWNSEKRLHLSVCLPLIKVGWKMMSVCIGTKKNSIPHGTFTKLHFPGMFVEGLEEPRQRKQHIINWWTQGWTFKAPNVAPRWAAHRFDHFSSGKKSKVCLNHLHKRIFSPFIKEINEFWQNKSYIVVLYDRLNCKK